MDQSLQSLVLSLGLLCLHSFSGVQWEGRKVGLDTGDLVGLVHLFTPENLRGYVDGCKRGGCREKTWMEKEGVHSKNSF